MADNVELNDVKAIAARLDYLRSQSGPAAGPAQNSLGLGHWIARMMGNVHQVVLTAHAAVDAEVARLR